MEVKWIYKCKTVCSYGLTVDERAECESEEEAIKWCEQKANEHPGISFEYSKSCYIPKILNN